MKKSAVLKNDRDRQQVVLRTSDNARTIEMPPRTPGGGSSVNGGEFLALATRYCNDVYREAGKQGRRACECKT